jgi:hypothetical protein
MKMKFFKKRETIGVKKEVLVAKKTNVGTCERGQSCNLFGESS